MDPRKQKRLGPAPIASFEKSFEDNTTTITTTTTNTTTISALTAALSLNSCSGDGVGAAAAEASSSSSSWNSCGLVQSSMNLEEEEEEKKMAERAVEAKEGSNIFHGNERKEVSSDIFVEIGHEYSWGFALKGSQKSKKSHGF